MPAFAGHDGFFYPLPLAIDKSLHQPLRLAGQEGLPEYADAQLDGFLQRQVFPLAEQGFLRAQGFRSAFQQGRDRLLDRSIEAAARLAGAHLEDINSDIHASEEYRRAMIPVFTERALARAMARVG